MNLRELGVILSWFFVRSGRGRKRRFVRKALSSNYSALLYEAGASLKTLRASQRWTPVLAWCCLYDLDSVDAIDARQILDYITSPQSREDRERLS
jgi:hypothetical protein